MPIQDDLISILKDYKKDSYSISKASTFEVDGYKNFVFISGSDKIKTPNSIVRTLHGIRDSYNRQETELAYE